MSGRNRKAISDTIAGLDRWFDTMRVDWPTPGYGGPVVHWWNHSLAYEGAGLDWRYEGIIGGYLTIWQETGDRAWLDKAVRAGADLVSGQLPDGHFRNSSFELNPESGGTPHEAAADIGLLLLARELRSDEPALSAQFLGAARRNLESYWFEELWHAPTATLWDSPTSPSFVPNKAATFIEAVLLLSTLTNDNHLIERFAIPTAARILGMQITVRTSPLHGAIAQNRFGAKVVRAYFPLYIARCIPPLLQLFEQTGDDRLRDSALSAAWFLARIRETDGSFPQVLYGNGKVNRSPRWIAGTGDIVRALLAANKYGANVDVEPTVDWIVRGVRSDGHIATAAGFGKIVPILSRRDRFADEIGVAGWCDKAFRALALLHRPVSTSRELAPSLVTHGGTP